MSELAIQIKTTEKAAQDLEREAATAASPDVVQNKLRSCAEDLAALRAHRNEQQAQVDKWELQRIKGEAGLARLRTQRNALMARMKVAAAQRRVEGTAASHPARFRHKRTAVLGLASIAAVVLVAFSLGLFNKSKYGLSQPAPSRIRVPQGTSRVLAPPIAPAPADSPSFYRQRAESRVRFDHDWSGADKDLAKAIELDPDDMHTWHRRTTLLVKLRRGEMLTKHLSSFLQRFRDRLNWDDRGMLLHSLAMAPCIGLKAIPAADSLADELLQRNPGEEKVRPAIAWSWYRAGRYDEANVLLSNFSNPDWMGGPYSRPHIVAIASMVNARLGNRAAAADLLRKAKEAFSQALLDNHALDDGDFGGNWWDRLSAEAILEEAEKTINQGDGASGLRGNMAGASHWLDLVRDAANGKERRQRQKLHLDSSLPSARKLVDAGERWSWSPDGDRIAYIGESTNSLLIRDLAGGEISYCVADAHDPAWSPGDGRWIAFERRPPGGADAEQVWLCSAAGGEARRLCDGAWPSWSIDGKTLYCLWRGKIVAVHVDPPQSPTTDVCAMPYRYPAISPDGKRVAFGNGGKLIVIDCKTGATIRSCDLAGWNGLLASWSPDGKQIAFGGFGGDNRMGLWMLDVGSGRKIQVVDGPCTMPGWSPDGKKFAFQSRGAECDAIWLIDEKARADLDARLQAAPAPPDERGISR